MSYARIGGNLTDLKERVDSPEIAETVEGVRVTRTYDIDYDQAETVVGALAFGAADADEATAKLREKSYTKDGPQNAIVTLVFVPDEWTLADPPESLPPVGTVILESDANPITVPISQNSNVSPGDIDEDKQLGKGDLAGVDGYLSPQPTFQRTEILDAFTFSEANVVEDVAFRFTSGAMAAKGLSGATTDNWLKVGLRVRTVGDKFEKVERWQYAENGWNETLYPNQAS